MHSHYAIICILHTYDTNIYNYENIYIYGSIYTSYIIETSYNINIYPKQLLQNTQQLKPTAWNASAAEFQVQVLGNLATGKGVLGSNILKW